MKVPKQMKRLCPKCKKHTPHKVSQAKRKGLNATHHQTWGSRKRQSLRNRGVGIGMGNRGRFSRKAITKFKMTGKKLTKKTDFRYECGECKYVSVQATGMRLKKVEIQ
ncbi:50S ribosomal protein L44e [Candidatus Woesearchaeota archaeon]|jgi:large subunit ribosomal protein L44e|nr:50S ribosomal protein L44e [Candidatus Woesearchaeota archaeon]MBT4368421.1 50S ribosomal protein L44e [Candidatus Woesearchaeota archaeon]MBT4712910.1 50S ribosomal protein L44e [Candidatus Woesearchaeota archaeon]MBT6639822.1 50S ribosomal protein L44e [Candidatus Woesearchaeota archaeon]MBT7133994.1 50S ribosomal protein L44e [Candidatus Woesearchaeota archaeon]